MNKQSLKSESALGVEGCAKTVLEFGANTEEMRALKIKRRIKSMTVDDIKDILKELNVEILGETKKSLSKQLREVCSESEHAENLVLKRVIPVKCPYKYIFVIDFEATCDATRSTKSFYPHEIIEFPAVLLDTEQLKVIDTFHAYVRPAEFPVLSDFCKELTGISQETIEKSDMFAKVLDDFCNWMRKYVKLNESYAIVTDGSYDLERFLVLQCIFSQIDYPSFGKNWINIKMIFSEAYKVRKISLVCMLQAFGRKFEGKLHSGKDDAYNIALLVIALLKDDVPLKVNEKITSEVIRQQTKLISSHLGRPVPPIKISRSTRKLAAAAKKRSKETVKSENEYPGPEIEVDPVIAGTEFVLLLKNNKIK